MGTWHVKLYAVVTYDCYVEAETEPYAIDHAIKGACSDPGVVCRAEWHVDHVKRSDGNPPAV